MDGPALQAHLAKPSRSWVICGAAVSCLGQLLSEMAEAAFQLQGADTDTRNEGME